MPEPRVKGQKAGPTRGSKIEKIEKIEKMEKILPYIIILSVFALVAAAYLAGRYYRNHKHDSFARCLASRNVRMYGLYWCPHCAEQKREFGSAFRYVPYIECASENDPHELTPACKAAGVKLFPSWQFGADPPKEGVLSLQALSEATGCSLP